MNGLSNGKVSKELEPQVFPSTCAKTCITQVDELIVPKELTCPFGQTLLLLEEEGQTGHIGGNETTVDCWLQPELPPTPTSGSPHCTSSGN